MLFVIWGCRELLILEAAVYILIGVCLLPEKGTYPSGRNLDQVTFRSVPKLRIQEKKIIL